MTAKEQLMARVLELSEAEAGETLRLIEEHRYPGDPGQSVDEWGSLDAWTDAASKETMRMLDEEEAAAGLSWEQGSTT